LRRGTNKADTAECQRRFDLQEVPSRVFKPFVQVLVERAAGNCGGDDSGSVLMGLGPGAQLRVSQVLGRGWVLVETEGDWRKSYCDRSPS
jgi:hypothetical protein